MRRAFIAIGASRRRSLQQGAALLAFVILLSLGGAFFLVNSLNKASTTFAADRDKKTQQSLRDAKAALLGYIARNAALTTTTIPGQFPCPENASYIGLATEGQVQTSCTSAIPKIGRLPWATIGTGDLRDGWGEKLWYVLSPGFRTSPINSTVAGQLLLDGKAVVALIISPGPAINAQTRTVVTTAQTYQDHFDRAPAYVYQQYLDGENATAPADFNFTSTGSTDSFNDWVIAITANEVFDIVEPIVAQRIGNSASADSLYYELNNYATAWGGSTNVYPFAATFANPSTAGYTQFRGVTNTYQGLIPASSTSNDPTFVTWSTAITVTTLATTVGSILGTPSCATSGLSPKLTLTCTINYRRSGSGTPNTPLVNITVTANNVGKAFRSPIASSEISCTYTVTGSGSQVPIAKQLEARNISDTTRQMDEVKEGLTGFALANGRLPCPADPTIASGVANAGIERGTCNTGSNMSGVLPWATLGLRETDAWGRRLTYRVTKEFADTIVSATYGLDSSGAACSPSPTPSSASYALCSAGDITISTKTTSSKTATAIASNAVAIIISHGKNGYGAWLPAGTQMSSPPAVNVDETLNKTVGTSFMNREFSDFASTCSDTSTSSDFCEYDDIVAWIPYTTLLGKTVAAGKLP